MASGLNIILAGPPGSGKSTQARILSDRYGIPHISTGDLVRHYLEKNPAAAARIGQAVKSGALAPEELVIKLLTDRLKLADCEKGFILDGFPRHKNQVTALDTILKNGKRTLDIVFIIALPDRDVIQRICGRFNCAACKESYHETFKPPASEKTCDTCGATGAFVKRPDDRPDAVTARLKLYHREIREITPVYMSRKIALKVNGQGNAAKIGGLIIKQIDEKLADRALSVLNRKHRGPRYK